MRRARYDGLPDCYNKRHIQAGTVNAAGRDCGRTRGMAYVMHEERRFGLPQEWYAALLERAYERFGFEQEILREALAYTAEHC